MALEQPASSSSSESGAGRLSLCHTASPVEDDSSAPNENEFDSESPRKRRRFSDEKNDIHKSSLPALSRIKPRKTNTTKVNQPTKVPATVTEARKGGSTTTDDSFSSLGVRPWLVSSLKAMAITRPTGIQRGCIPQILVGRDCIGGSKTGSGKTMAFAVPIIQTWAEDPFGIYAVILTPTRELALQMFEQFKAISAQQALKAVLVTGGADMREQALALSRRPHVVIATPGRLADHIENSGEDTICGLRRVKMVVLDEADRLLDSSGPGSMLPDVDRCLSVLPSPKDRQTLLFTATVTPEVRALKEQRRQERKPSREVFICEVDASMTLAVPESLKQEYLQIPLTHREAFLHILLLTPLNAEKSTIIFTNRTATADLLHHMLRLLDHRVTALHSGLPQRSRIDNLARFRASAARVLVATDVAARGLDIPVVELVINYDLPRDPNDYIHRVGRTARAGRKGEAISLVSQRDVQLILAIEQRVGRKMAAFEEEGVSVEGRVVRDGLKKVGEKKREALLEIEEGKDVGGRRRRR